MTMEDNQTTATKAQAMRDCGPEGCQVDWLSSKRHRVELEISDFTDFAMEQGWGDGLPLVPPTESRIREFLAAGSYYPDEVICRLAPENVDCTVEKIAINAVMAGAPPQSMPLLVAALKAMADPSFDLGGLNVTTAAVVPALIVNGPIRDVLDIPYQEGCLGGAATKATAIGRALRLIMRNVAGQVTGVTSQSVFGSPGRVAGILFGEWEERSPWAPLSERRGISGNAVTAYGTNGTQNILDMTSQEGMSFLEHIGKSLSYPGANGYSPGMPFSEILVAINPVWAEIIHGEVPAIEDVQEIIWRHASCPADYLTPNHRDHMARVNRIHSDGRVYVATEPKDVLVMVCGGTGSLHATGLHSWGTCVTTTRPIE